MRKKVSAIAKLFIKSYILYVLVAGLLVFACNTTDPTSYLSSSTIQQFLSMVTGPERVVLVEESRDAILVRLAMIKNAKETLDIAYHTLQSGPSTDLFFASVVDAADRGVQVRILLDGIYHNLRGDLQMLKDLLTIHPNITLSFYEPLNLFLPWTWQNRLHDKIILVDSACYLTGGRNIGDRYFSTSYADDVVYDRDILVYRTENSEESSVAQMQQYFASLWDSPFSQRQSPPRQVEKVEKAYAYQEELRQWAIEINNEHPLLLAEPSHWKEKSFPTNKVTLIHNPLERGNKEPLIWAQIAKLIAAAKEEVIIQSPYIVPTRPMRKVFPESREADITLLTNSSVSTPNPLAFSGYLNRKKRLEETAEVYEYHGDGSIHGKSMVFDERLSLVGTFNVDPRSTYLSTETMVVIDSDPFAEALLARFSHIQQQSYPSRESPPASLPKRILLSVLQVLTYPISFLL